MLPEKEIQNKSSTIIDLLSDCNYAEKYRILSSLLESLKDVIHSEGGQIFEENLDG